MYKKKRSFTLTTALCAVILPVTASLAQHGEHGQHEHEEAETAIPTTYAGAMKVIEFQLEKIDTLIASGELDRVHAEAAVIRDVAGTLVRLALDKESGVPRTAIRTINLTAKELAAKFGPIDAAGDSGNLAGTERVYEEMIALFERLRRHAPDREHSVEVEPMGGAIEPNVPATLRFTIKDAAGAVAKDLEIVHEKILHVLMVSDDLSWYAHEHPVVQRDGTFRLRFTFPRAGEYALFNDFTVAGVGQVVPVRLRVEGTPPPAVPLVVDSKPYKQVDGFRFRLDTAGPIDAGREVVLTYEISRDGRPVGDLEPYLGAMGHLAVVSEDLEHFVHSHPLGKKHGESRDHGHEGRETGRHDEHGGFAAGSSRSTITFHTRFPEAGLYKSWAQFKHRGRILTVPFVLEVGLPEGHDTEQGHQGEHEHHD